MRRIPPLPITAMAAVSAAGAGSAALLAALEANRSPLAPPRLLATDIATYVGEYPHDLRPLRPELARFDCRNARLALAALDADGDGLRAAIERAKANYGAARIGVVIGTSTSGMLETELAYAELEQNGAMPPRFGYRHQHIWVATARYLQQELALAGPCYAISTACSSGGKAIACAQRLIAAGICDAVVAGGVDSICHLTLYGFTALELTSPERCTPLDAARRGISLGEGGGLVLLERSAPEFADRPHLLGVGESSDAHHMTAPHPQGAGSLLAMQRSLAQAGLTPDAIDYVNLHATGTPLNDASEMQAIAALFADTVPVSGTKGITGHTLGAAGGIEAVIALLALQHGLLPGTAGLSTPDPAFAGVQILAEPQRRSLRRTMSNNFGFGGNNASLIFGHPDA